MRRYEALIVLDPDMLDDDVKALTEKFGGIITDHAGEIIKIEDWGTKKLAYLVRRKDKGRYILFDFVSGPTLINELERQFKITDDVMKYLTVKLDDDVDLEAFKAKAEEEVLEGETAEPIEEISEAAPTIENVEPQPQVTEAPEEKETPIQSEPEGSSTKEEGQ
jgi:small subunit ribosomal protein S6